MKSERKRQQEAAIITGHAYCYRYLCHDGNHFECVAISEKRAFLVLNAERPGIMGELVHSRKAVDSDYR